MNANLCILRENQSDDWQVVLCGGNAPTKVLGRFEEFARASEFAVQYRDQLQADTCAALCIHFPDDCPCYKECRH
jgi:hypothetical protein